MRLGAVTFLAFALVSCTSRNGAEFEALQTRGQTAMGVNQYTSTHKFDALADGGRIELQRDTNDTRESAAIFVCRDLLAEQAQVVVYDPKVPANEIRDEVLGKGKSDARLVVVDDPYEAAKGAHAVAVVTEWDEFKWLDYDKIATSMARRCVVDARNILDKGSLLRRGFSYTGVGRI